MKKMEYKTPEIEELQFVVEGGFNTSNYKEEENYGEIDLNKQNGGY